MAVDNKNSRFRWRGQTSFVVIAVGATLSLKDFLTFPVMAGENGGGAFLLLYALFLFLLGFPLLVSEFMLGRLTRNNFVDAVDQLSTEHSASVYWKTIAALALLAGILVLSSYSVISGWSLAYFFKTGLGVFSGATADGVNALFKNFRTDTEAMMLWHTLFVILMVSISAQSLKKGLQRVFLILVPLMVGLLLIGLLYAFYSGGMLESIEYILMPDWSRVDASMPLLALQRAFFTLTLGLGVMVIYGAYLDEEIPLGYVTGQVILIDLLFSIFAGLAINALVFSVDMEPVLDDELAFRVLPVMFGAFQYGAIFGALFYLLLVLAAITTSVAILEAILSFYMLKYRQTRLKATAQLGLFIWLLGLGTIFSYSVWNESGLTLTMDFGNETYRLVNEAGFQDVIIFISSHFIQPLVALMLSLYVGWIIPRKISFDALKFSNRKYYEIWNFSIRYITPVLVFIVFLSTMGLVNK